MKIATFRIAYVLINAFKLECLTVQRQTGASSQRHDDVRLWHGPKDNTTQVP